MWKRITLYGVFLAAGTLALQWLDYQRLARAHSGDVYVFMIAAAFLALGVWLVFGPFRLLVMLMMIVLDFVVSMLIGVVVELLMFREYRSSAIHGGFACRSRVLRIRRWRGVVHVPLLARWRRRYRCRVVRVFPVVALLLRRWWCSFSTSRARSSCRQSIP